MKKIILFFSLILLLFNADAQIAKTQVVMVSATANANGSITLSWPAEVYTGQFSIYRRNSQLTEDWGATAIGVVPGNINTYTDNNVKEGEAFEYMVVKASTATDALGYIYAGNKFTEITFRGGIILAIDSNYLTPLQTEIKRLQDDLIAEGWKVNTISVGRKESVVDVKTRIKNNYDLLQKHGNVSLLLLGHIPVPYSGYFSSTGSAPPPDGHVEGSGNHTGAWPADVYYGDFDGEWTDGNVICTTGNQTRHHNVIGDGKFDNTKIPWKVELEIGRVDLFGMTTFTANDTLLTKKYLDRNHLWRTGKTVAVERALIDNNFGSLNLASTGYQTFAALIQNDSIFSNRDYMTSQKNGSYLWSYGCGAGSYTSCNGIGNTAAFNNDSFSNVFTILAGSYFGDYDINNNYLRAPLAISSLASFWGGIPKWYVHHMGLGKHIGYGAKLTQNNKTFYFNGSFNASSNSVHIALMGDPTLRMRNLNPPSNLTANSANKKVYLNWHSAEIPADGYNIYIVDSTNKYTKVNSNIITDTFFVDEHNYNTGNYTYAVASSKLETTPSGTYYNISGASFANVSHVNAIAKILNDKDVQVFPNPTSAHFTIKANEELNCTIYAIDGKLIGNYTINNHVDIECSNWRQGVYILSFTNNKNQSLVKKVVKL